MKYYLTSVLMSIFTLVLLSGCDASDKAAIEAAKENQLAQKSQRDTWVEKSRNLIKDQGIGKSEHKFYCTDAHAYGYTFKPNDSIDKWCLEEFPKLERKATKIEPLR